MSSQDSQLFKDVLGDFKESQENLSKRLNVTLRKLESTFDELDDIVRMHSSQLKEYNRLVNILRELENSQGNGETLSEYWKQLLDLKTMLDQMKASKPRTGTVFLKYTLGHVNMKVWKRADIYQMKLEYNKFKRRNTYMFILFSLLNMVPSWYVSGFHFDRIFGTLQQLFMLYYYASLALRENILQVNGSEIKDWWIQHHYLSMILAVLILLLPDSPAYQEFLWYSNSVVLFQGIVMMVQNSYQDKRHYVRTTLGKAKLIDPSVTETIIEKPVDLQILIPLLFVIYTAEFILSGWSLNLGFQYQSRQLAFIGIVIFFIALGNTVTTSTVLFSKHKIRSFKNLRSSSSNKTA